MRPRRGTGALDAGNENTRLVFRDSRDDCLDRITVLGNATYFDLPA
jgi:hypothetical protein